ncbi:MAG: DinB family protein [Acidobacteriaceae bacterium]
MDTRPQNSEAAPPYFTYIDQVADGDIVAILDGQIENALAGLSAVSEERSLNRYASGKWSMREMLNHITDTERVFSFRTLWFARGLTGPLPGFDQNIGVAGAGADAISWSAHIEEFRRVRLATVALFGNLSPEAWSRSGTADGNLFTVRAIAYILAGHMAHHLAILRERYN